MQRTKERVYVKVNADIDTTGYMLPRTIIWSDGRCFHIDAVKNFRPASAVCKGRTSDCFTIVIHGIERLLFFERTDTMFSSRFGRWFVECPVSAEDGEKR